MFNPVVHAAFQVRGNIHVVLWKSILRYLLIVTNSPKNEIGGGGVGVLAVGT